MTVSEANLITQLQNAVNLLEYTREFLDDNVAGGTPDLLNVLAKSVEGVYTPIGLVAASTSYRAAASSLLSGGRVQEFLEPILFEYAQLIDEGKGYRDPAQILKALYEYMAHNTVSVESRAITYDVTPTKSSRDGGAIIGTGGITRLTTDENGFNLEACHVERKTFRCRVDANNGAVGVEAEVFEVIGDPSSPDNLGRAATGIGSGDFARALVPSFHAGGGDGGSILNNSSFENYKSTATPKFTNWTEVTGGSDISNETTTVYRSFPGEATSQSMKLTWSGTTINVKQLRTAFRRNRLDSEAPYFLRVMVNKGTATAGNIVVRMGSQSTTVAVTALAAGWNEVTMAIDTPANQKKMWFRQFNEADLGVELEWNGGTTSGHILYFDDVIFTPWRAVDGTYWAIRGNAATHTAWLVDDILELTDTGGAPATGKIQWYFFQGYGVYMPSSGTPSIADPT